MESVRRQRLPEGVSLEYIVVDGASTDGTAAKIRECADQVEAGGDGLTFKWISEKDQGLYDAINKGIHMAKSCGVPFAAAGWGNGIEAVRRFFLESGAAYFETVEQLQAYLFE